MGELVVVRSKIKEHAQGLNVAGDFAEALHEEVVKLSRRPPEGQREKKREHQSQEPYKASFIFSFFY